MYEGNIIYAPDPDSRIPWDSVPCVFVATHTFAACKGLCGRVACAEYYEYTALDGSIESYGTLGVPGYFDCELRFQYVYGLQAAREIWEHHQTVCHGARKPKQQSLF